MMTMIFMGEEEEARKVVYLPVLLVAKVLVLVAHSPNMEIRSLDPLTELVHKE